MPILPFDTYEAADTRDAELWDAAKRAGWQPGNVTTRLYGVRVRPDDPGEPTELPDGVDVAIVVNGRDEHLDRLVAGTHVTAEEAVTVAPLYPAWAVGTEYSVNDIVRYDGALYVVRQAHTAQPDWQTPNVLALYMVYRRDAGTTLEWIPSESVTVGMRRVYDSVIYECIQSHVTQSDWTPPAVPALWRVVVDEPDEPEEPTVAAWAVGVAYKVGDVVTYNGISYSCRQSHTSLPGWEPPNVPALWLPL